MRYLLPLAALTAWQILLDAADAQPGQKVLITAAGCSSACRPEWTARSATTSGPAPILVEPDRAGLEAITALVESGELKVHVGATFPLEDAGKAHALGETGRTQGKIVLEV